MEMLLNLILLPAIVGLTLKLYLLARVAKSNRASVIFLSLVVIFSLHNAIEIFSIGHMLSAAEGSTLLEVLRPYYIITTFTIMYITLHALTVSSLINKGITSILVASATIISAFMIFSDSIIAGNYSIGYAISAIKGDYFWVFAIFSLICITTSVAALIYGQRRSSTQIQATHCKYCLLALIPIFLVGITILAFKFMNIPFNAIALMPIASTLFLFIVIKTESKHKLSDIKPILPLSLERKTADNFLNMLDEYVQNSNQDNVYKTLQASIEREIICYSLKKSNNNITHTANMMGLKNRSTLYSMLNRHGIDLKELKTQNELAT